MDGNPQPWQPSQQPQDPLRGAPFDYGEGPPSSGAFPSGGVPSGGQPPGAGGPGGGLPPTVLVGLGVIVVLVLAIGAVLVTDSGGGGGDDDDPGMENASGVGDEEEPVDDRSATTAPAEDPAAADGTDDGADDTTDEGGGRWDVIDPASLPAVEIPGEDDAERPELRDEHDGLEHPYNPFDGEYWPIIGEVYVDSVPGEHIDVPVYMEEGQLTVMFTANDQVFSEIEIYDPAGGVIGTVEELGEPGVLEGYEFSDDSDDALTETGVYVFRVIQHSGVEGGFPMRFFTPDGPDGADGE